MSILRIESTSSIFKRSIGRQTLFFKNILHEKSKKKNP